MSTSRILILPIICLAACLLAVQSAAAGSRTFAVIPFEYVSRNIATGLTEVLTAELNAGHLQAVGQDTLFRRCDELGLNLADLGSGSDAATYTQLAPLADYLLVGEITAFKIADKDQPVDLSDELNDLSRLMGQGSETAHVALDLSLIATTDGREVAHWLIDGVESRYGTRMKTITYGWAGSVDVRSDEFRETMIGRASYKALGSVIYHLYELFPIEGIVLAVSGDAVVLDLDEADGLQIGDELTVVRRRVITNTEGVIAWENDEPVGRVEVVEFQPGRCLCLVLEGNGDISENDLAIPVVSRLILPQFADTPEQ